PAPFRTLRRVVFSASASSVLIVSSSSGERAGGALDRGANPHVRGTPADVAGHRSIDIRICRLLVLLEQRDCAHDLPRLTVAALGNVLGDPRLLHRLADIRF